MPDTYPRNRRMVHVAQTCFVTIEEVEPNLGEVVGMQGRMTYASRLNREPPAIWVGYRFFISTFSQSFGESWLRSHERPLGTAIIRWIEGLNRD